jgi:capsid portal protein
MTDEPREVDVFVAKHTRRAITPDNLDPFTRKGEDLRSLKGLDNTTRKRMTRGIDKAYVGADGSKSKQLDQFGTIDAYNLFGVVLPPYNLDYLAKIYEMSSPHYAAVKVKVANITGLGFDFVESPAARRKMDDVKTDAGKKKMRKNIEKERDALYEWLDECNDQDEFIETLQKVWTDYETTGNGYFEVGRDLQGRVAYIGHIPAQTMRVRIHRDGYVQVVANQVVFFRNLGDKKT